MDEQDLDRLLFHEVDPDRWPDLERLFEGRGGPKNCWCMVWREMPAAQRNTMGEEGRTYRRDAMRERVLGGVPVGLLAYLDGEPVAWCSIAPRSTYRPLGGPEDPDGDDGNVWSLACFFIQRRLRGHGMSRRLLRAAVDHARVRGATVVEAYPVDPDSPSYRFMGFVPLFREAGFREVGRAGSRRYVMRLEIDPHGSSVDPTTAG